MTPDRRGSADSARLDRIESKLDRLAEGFVALARFEERMITLFKRVEGYDAMQIGIVERLSKVEKIAIERGIFFRWVDRLAMAVLGAGAALVLSWLA